MMNKSIIFDLDGTLINSLNDIALSMNQVLKSNRFNEHPIEKYNYFVGDGALILVKNALPKNSDDKLVNKLLKEFITIYDNKIHNNTKPYDGIYELLDKLEIENIKKGVLSNKPHKFTLQYVNSLFSKYNFQEVHGQKDQVPKKPDPTMALNINKIFGTSLKNSFFVGDTSTDMKTAKNAGMIAIGVAWGFRPIEELIEFGADFIAHTPMDIYEYVKNR